MEIINSFSQIFSEYRKEIELVLIVLPIIYIFYISFRYPRFIATLFSKILDGFFISFDVEDVKDARKKEIDELRAGLEQVRAQLAKEAIKAVAESAAEQSNGSLSGAASAQSNSSGGATVMVERATVRRRRMDFATFARVPNTKLIDFLLHEGLQKEDPPHSAEELLNFRDRVSEYETRERQQSELEKVLSKQLDNATRIRGLMTNLFVVVNFAVIIAILFKSDQILANKEIVLGLYISFATFMVYVYRSSNARALILMAGMEDIKRYHDVDKYVRAIGRRGPTERDIDVLKLLTINRMEREKNGEHPYELVLKGISNSNILFKGGKISATSKEKTNDKEKESR